MYVDLGTASVTPDGSIANPYASIQAGIAAAPFGATILITPGDYNESLVVPSGMYLTLSALGDPQTPSVRVFSNAGEALLWNTSGGDNLNVQGILFQTTAPGTFAVAAQGNGIANLDTFTARNCNFFGTAGGLSLEFLASYLLQGCGGKVMISNCNGGLCQGLTFGEAFCEVSDPIPPAVFFGYYLFTACNIDGDGGITQSANSRIRVDKGTYCKWLFFGFPTAEFSRLEYQGSYENIDARIDDKTPSNLFLDGATCVNGSSSFTTAAIGVDPYVSAKGADLGIVNCFDGGGGATNTLDNRGGSIEWNGSSIGKEWCVDRDSGAAELNDLTNGLNVLSFANVGGTITGPRFPPSATVEYCIQARVLPAVPTDAIVLTSPTPNGVNATNGYVANQDAYLVYNRVNS